jgi:ubiquinone/menaquinone biosynthesis C-methylase UbiE
MAIKQKLMQFYWTAEKWIAPGLRSSQYVYAEALIAALRPGIRWLDLGCGHQFFPEWMPAEQELVAQRRGYTVGIDMDWVGLRRHPQLNDRVFGNLEQLPFASESFDLITANMVVEHLQDADAVLREVRRLLRPSGRFLFHTPNQRGLMIRVAKLVPDAPKKKIIEILQDRPAEDVFPTHYKLNVPEKIYPAAEKAGLRVRKLELVNTSATLAMIPPLAVAELAYMRALDWARLNRWKTNLIVELERPAI